MKRTDFKKIIKLSSDWKLDKRRGNYKLPDGSKLFEYLQNFIFEYLQKNNLGILKNGNICCVLNNQLFVPFGENEAFVCFEQFERARKIARELIF